MKALLFTLLSFVFSHAAYAENEIYVELAGDVQLIPIYVSPIENGPQNSLRDVLLFDLNHNGMTRVLTAKEIAAKHSLKGQETFDNAPQFAKLKNEDILYLVKLKIQGSELHAKLFFVNSHEVKSIDGIQLSGDPQKDRKKMHALANVIYELLFGKKGIANSRILYTVKKKIDRAHLSPLWVSEVYEADYDGQNVRQITHDRSLSATPQYVPGPTKACMYVSYKIGQPKIYTIPLQGGTPKRVSQLRGNQLTPVLNKDASFFAFASDTTGKADIFYQKFSKDGQSKPRQIFTAKGAANASPSFSPDGRRIAFVSNKDGSPKIYVMAIPAEGSKLKDVKPSLISKRCKENSAPKWSPDGKKIAFCAKTSGDRQIWMYDFETNQERQLTSGKGVKENPAWAPDSLHLLFNCTLGDQTEIYLINLNQPDAVKVTSGPGAKMFPAWEP